MITIDKKILAFLLLCAFMVQFNAKHTSVTREALGSENLDIEGIGFTKPHQLVVFGKMCAERGFAYNF